MRLETDLFTAHLKRYKLSKHVQASLSKILFDDKQMKSENILKSIDNGSYKKKSKSFEILATVSKDVIPLSWKQPLVFMITSQPDAFIKINEAPASLKENSLKFSQLLTLLVEIDKNLVSLILVFSYL